MKYTQGICKDKIRFASAVELNVLLRLLNKQHLADTFSRLASHADILLARHAIFPPQSWGGKIA